MSSHGGYTDAARALEQAYGLTKTGRKFTRQQVWAWHRRRVTNRFPDRYPVVENGEVRQLFRLAEVVAWYPLYVPDKGGRPRGNGRGNS